MKCLLFSSNFNQTSIFSKEFSKNPKYKIPQKSVQQEPSCSVQTDDEHTHMTKLSFFTTANMPKKPWNWKQPIGHTQAMP
jgi:hypothetical protein